MFTAAVGARGPFGRIQAVEFSKLQFETNFEFALGELNRPAKNRDEAGTLLCRTRKIEEVIGKLARRQLRSHFIERAETARFGIQLRLEHKTSKGRLRFHPERSHRLRSHPIIISPLSHLADLGTIARFALFPRPVEGLIRCGRKSGILISSPAKMLARFILVSGSRSEHFSITPRFSAVNRRDLMDQTVSTVL